MFTLMCDIFIMCFVLSEILSLEEEKEYSRSLFPSAAAAAAIVVVVSVVVVLEVVLVSVVVVLVVVVVAVTAAASAGGWWRREEEVYLGVIITNTEIKFHILLFTLH